MLLFYLSSIYYYQGRQCLLVTSGAIALGRHHLETDEKKSSRGARAAIGMAEMVTLYDHLFEQCDLRTAAVCLFIFCLHFEL